MWKPIYVCLFRIKIYRCTYWITSNHRLWWKTDNKMVAKVTNHYLIQCIRTMMMILWKLIAAPFSRFVANKQMNEERWKHNLRCSAYVTKPCSYLMVFAASVARSRKYFNGLAFLLQRQRVGEVVLCVYGKTASVYWNGPQMVWITINGTRCWRVDSTIISNNYHDDVIKWKHFPRSWPFVRGIHRSPVNSPHKGQWRGALIFILICARINGWVNNCKAGDLTRNRAHYDVIVMRNAVTFVLWKCTDISADHQKKCNETVYTNIQTSDKRSIKYVSFSKVVAMCINLFVQAAIQHLQKRFKAYLCHVTQRF